MSDDSLMPILLGIAFLILLTVVAFVIILSAIRRSRSRPRGGAEQPSPPTESGSRSPVPDRELQDVHPTDLAGQPESPLPAVGPVDLSMDRPATSLQAGEVLRVIRDPQTGESAVQIQGQQYRHIREIKDPELGKQVLAAIADLVRFTGGVAANPQAMRKILAKDTPAEPSPSTRDAEWVEPRQTPSLAQDALLDPAALTPPRQRPGVMGYLLQGFQPREPPAPLPSPTAFVDEIEAILQGYIRQLATPLSQEVHVGSGPDGLLQIQVGLTRYNHPDDVPDPEVRQLIKAAVAEWERR